MRWPLSTIPLALVALVLSSCSGLSVSDTARPAAAEPTRQASEPGPPPAPDVVDVVAGAPSRDDTPRFDRVLATAETRYRRWKRGRAHNVELSAARLDGAVLEPGGLLSFNDRVGPRSRRAGFRRAPVIIGGELTDGLGGGVCQTASTLHAAAWNAGLDVVEHQPHSRPSGYIRMGLDATVVWPRVDLKLRNPFEFPVLVRAETTDDGRLAIRLLGAEAPREVESDFRVLARRAFGERFVDDPELPLGEVEVSQEGMEGATVERIRVVREGGEATTILDVVRYPPTDRVIRIGTGT